MNAQQKSPEEIREEIGETREELGDTVEALAGKADVKGQAKAKVDEAKGKVDSAKVSPVPIAVAAAFGAGIVVGWLLAR